MGVLKKVSTYVIGASRLKSPAVVGRSALLHPGLSYMIKVMSECKTCLSLLAQALFRGGMARKPLQLRIIDSEKWEDVFSLGRRETQDLFSRLKENA
jgi:hypothetical protein